MSQKTNKPTVHPATIPWSFSPDIPTDDFFDGGSLDDIFVLQEAVYIFVSMLEHGDFLTWEAAVCKERGLPLTLRQKEAFESILNFNEDADPGDPILYIDEIARPSEPWHVILNKIAPHLRSNRSGHSMFMMR